MRTRQMLTIAVILLITTAAWARSVQDKIRMHRDATGPIEFSHYLHLEKVGKNCPSCHNSLYAVGNGTKKKVAVTMQEMENKGKSCGACHNGAKAFSVKGDCAKCHPTRDITFENDGGPVLFSHEVHTGMYKCGECHPALFLPEHGKNPKVSMEKMEKGDSCGACHDGSTAFTVKDNCDTCHKM